MSPNTVLSEKLHVAPLLKEGESATFILMNAGKKEPGREEPSTPEVWKLAGKHNVTDPYDKFNPRKTIGNVIGSIQVTEKGKPKADAHGQAIMIDEIVGVEFFRGVKTVTADQNSTYAYLMRRKDNKSNPFRVIMGGKSVKEVFKLVDDVKELQDILQMKEINYVAQILVRESTFSQLKAIATKMNQSADNKLHIRSLEGGEQSAIKLEMIQKAESYAKFVIACSDDQPSRLKVQIYECLKLGLLRFDKGSYWLLGKDYEQVHTPDADKDSIDSLMQYFMEDAKGQGKYQNMAEALKKILKA